MNLFRTYMYVPGIQEGMLAKAPERGADAYILDLEDSVPVAQKEKARGMVSKALPDIARRTSAALFVRVNAIGNHFHMQSRVGCQQQATIRFRHCDT